MEGQHDDVVTQLGDVSRFKAGQHVMTPEGRGRVWCDQVLDTVTVVFFDRRHPWPWTFPADAVDWVEKP